jgi:hypothetical protein
MRVIDVTTAEVLLALSADGTSKNDAVGFFNENISFVNGKFRGVEVAAISNAVAELAHNVRAVLGGESSYVIDVNGNEVVVDVTAHNEGALYLVYTDGKALTDMSGKSVGAAKIPIAVVKVNDVDLGRSTAVVVPNGGDKNLIQRGDKIEPISSNKAKQLADGKKFIKDRPKTESEAYAALFNGDSSPSSTPAQAAQAGTDSASDEFKWNDVEGVDRNSETGLKLIEVYPLNDVEKNTLGIAHRGAFNLYNKGEYQKALEMFSRLATDYKCDYFSAYWAGMSAVKIGDKQKASERDASYRQALDWFGKALEINPDYKPAVDARIKVESA